MSFNAADPSAPSEDPASASGRAEGPVLQGDIVRSFAGTRPESQLGWVCCITPENDEGHIYWQPLGDGAASDSREPLLKLRCTDRALIPGDIVRRCDGGEASGERRVDRDLMGMVVGTEVFLDLCEPGAKERKVRHGVPAASLRYLVPIRLVTWVVHRADGWLGRVQSWDEDLVIRFLATGDATGSVCRCRVRAANQKQGIAIVESFYRDFFPGLTVSVSLQELRSGALECEWLEGDLSQVAAANSPARGGLKPAEDPLQRVEATIEEVCVGAARVEWLAQVPLWRGWSTERPPRSDGCQEDKLLFLLGEAECSSRWALGDRALAEGVLAEVCGVQTLVDVRWQDDALSTRVPSRCLQLCNPDAFSFFPNELICQRSLEENAAGGGPAFRSGSPTSPTPATGSRNDASSGEATSGGIALAGSERARRDEPPRVGQVVRADPASRMVGVRWLDGKGAGGEDEEWSAFDLQIDPEFGYRLGDAVIRCRDWEEPSTRDGVSGPRVGQVTALEPGAVRVRWIDGSVSRHGPRELYRVGDEDEGSIEGSQMDTANESPVNAPDREADAPMPQAPTADLLDEKRLGSGDESTEEGATAGGMATEEDASTGRSAASDAGGPAPEPSTLLGGDASVAAVPTGFGGAPRTLGPATDMDVDGNGERPEMTLEDMAWEPLPTDHHFIHSAPTSSGPSDRMFMRRVQREWTILARGLPRGVWVHVYPDRMELLRACLVGPEGTPYSDALFFFDLLLPPTYPQIPPQVRFWSFGENLNPNLYENGKVCLSLLGTWSGKDSETWSPERSNLLQVLVSILGLVLNTEPYYNEPGFERERDTPQGGLRSQRYNESVALSNYHLMLRVLRTPPVDFDQIVKRHFTERRAAILERATWLQCSASSVCSEGFRKSLAALVPRLSEALPLQSDAAADGASSLPCGSAPALSPIGEAPAAGDADGVRPMEEEAA